MFLLAEFKFLIKNSEILFLFSTRTLKASPRTSISGSSNFEIILLIICGSLDSTSDSKILIFSSFESESKILFISTI